LENPKLVEPGRSQNVEMKKKKTESNYEKNARRGNSPSLEEGKRQGLRTAGKVEQGEEKKTIATKKKRRGA